MQNCYKVYSKEMQKQNTCMDTVYLQPFSLYDFWLTQKCQHSIKKPSELVAASKNANYCHWNAAPCKVTTTFLPPASKQEHSTLVMLKHKNSLQQRPIMRSSSIFSFEV